jgi:hypothetical protein
MIVLRKLIKQKGGHMNSITQLLADSYPEAAQMALHESGLSV